LQKKLEIYSRLTLDKRLTNLPPYLDDKAPNKWRHFALTSSCGEFALFCLYPISYRQLEEMMCDRGEEVDHGTLSQWFQKYAPERSAVPSALKPTNDSWRVASGQTYIKVKGRTSICIGQWIHREHSRLLPTAKTRRLAANDNRVEQDHRSNVN